VRDGAERSKEDSRAFQSMTTKIGEHPLVLTWFEQEEWAKKRLRELISQGLNSGPARALTQQRIAQLKKRAFGNLR
jgi:uncharacterized protein YoaH (UPF0181 family)